MTDPTPGPVESFADDSDDAKDATAIIRAYCGWHIAGVVADDVIDVGAVRGRVLLLPTTKLLDVAAVHDVRLDADYSSDLYEWSSAGIVTRRGESSTWPLGLRTLRITFTHGYEETPRELAAATRSLMRRLKANPTDAISETRKMGTASITRVFKPQSTAAERRDAAAEAFSAIERLVLDRFAVTPGAG